jgi:hypothetical protein
VSIAVPTLHEDFATSFRLSLDDGISPVTAEQIKSKFADTKAKLMLVVAIGK